MHKLIDTYKPCQWQNNPWKTLFTKALSLLHWLLFSFLQFTLLLTCSVWFYTFHLRGEKCKDNFLSHFCTPLIIQMEPRLWRTRERCVWFRSRMVHRVYVNLKREWTDWVSSLFLGKQAANLCTLFWLHARLHGLLRITLFCCCLTLHSIIPSHTNGFDFEHPFVLSKNPDVKKFKEDENLYFATCTIDKYSHKFSKKVSCFKLLLP